MRHAWFLRLGMGLVSLAVCLAMPAIGAAQAAAPEPESSSASGILAVLGTAALLAAGIYFWVRNDEPAPPANDEPGEPTREPEDEAG